MHGPCVRWSSLHGPHTFQKVLLHSINGHLRSSLFYDYLLVSDVLDINDLLDTRSLGMYSACMAPHFPALLCSVYRHCSFPRCYTSHCVCPSLNCVFPTALCCAQITSVVSNSRLTSSDARLTIREDTCARLHHPSKRTYPSRMTSTAESGGRSVSYRYICLHMSLPISFL